MFSGFASNYREITVSKRKKTGQICWGQGLVVGMRKKMERKGKGLGEGLGYFNWNQSLEAPCGLHSRADFGSWFSLDS